MVEAQEMVCDDGDSNNDKDDASAEDNEDDDGDVDNKCTSLSVVCFQEQGELNNVTQRGAVG